MEMSRRTFIRHAGAVLAPAMRNITLTASFGGLLCANVLAREAPATRTAEEWMDTWMKRNLRGAEGALHLSRFVEPMWFLLDPIKWTSNPGQRQYQPVIVPTGFVTDLASIPRVFWSWLPPEGEYAYASILHDYLYWTQIRPRETADLILKLSMRDFGVSNSTVQLIYQAVRKGGGSAWDNNMKLRQSGEKRILKRFPGRSHDTMEGLEEQARCLRGYVSGLV